MEHIYLDHAATTPVAKSVMEAMYPIYEEVFGNPSSVHSFGRKARHYLDEARHVLAKSIGANEKEIVLTSGGTEADNLAIIGTAMANQDKGNHIITTAQEHHATLHTAEYLEGKGFRVTYLPVYQDGKIAINDFKNALTDDTILVTMMTVNNETGIIQPIEEVGKLLDGHQAYFHTDAVQAFGLLELSVKELGVDLLSVSAHKINGPKGIGFLYVRNGVNLNRLQFGGEQERKRRAGTENVISAVGFQAAVKLAMENRENRLQQYQHFKQLFLDTLLDEGISFQLNGDQESAIASIVNISFPGTNVEALLTNFDLAGIAASSGSACTAGSIEPSHVLSAMFGSENERTKNSIRFSFGAFNTTENVSEAAQRVAAIVKRLTT
ncbi:aminotransferase class V-fold PLP-dependent enzyme [Virgibacillus dakarensis]|uniref:cysteine desulfurase family protein n=1 Tax=Virgibacillus dakarensis TaxID=1917889 RepID=UPI000B444CC4|nr:cysteine desulfurase family protein [Virgibacillus dakarensis]MBT2215112.1 cysteine desulfurase [Virgibacillus dakarensis]MTW84165.1 aminotransferase class V-fold PLP-dependent enzyme [Virgibacillus dakarensis]